MTLSDFILRIALALLFGAIIGAILEGGRQWRQRMAGLRTNTPVATGAALFVSPAGKIAEARHDAAMERIVSTLCREPTVSSIRWEVADDAGRAELGL